MKILLIEDEEELRNTVREYLTREKFIVECAEDYASAMEKVNDYDYDCILLDIMLPGGSGLSVLAHLKRMRKQESVIIISAKDSIEDKVEGLNLGADDYLAKPFHLGRAKRTGKIPVAQEKSRRRHQYRTGQPDFSPRHTQSDRRWERTEPQP